MVAKKRILTAGEKNAQESFLANLDMIIRDRRTNKPIIVAITGLVGSGKSEVAQALAKHIGATVIANDDIRIQLRKQKASYERTWAIAENVAMEVLKKGRNVILDSDFVDEKKRASIREKARQAGVRLVFIRTVCDFDVMSQRIRENDPGEFFDKAESLSTAEDKGKDVKFREMDRRKPHHYRWINRDGGKWTLKKLPFVVASTIDNPPTSPRAWHAGIRGS